MVNRSIPILVDGPLSDAELDYLFMGQDDCPECHGAVHVGASGRYFVSRDGGATFYEETSRPNCDCTRDYLGGLGLVHLMPRYVTVLAGHAQIDGISYLLEQDTSFSVPTPSVATRMDRMVLRKNSATQQMFLYPIQGIEGSGIAPPPVRAGPIFDVDLGEYLVTVSGVITLIDKEDQPAIEEKSEFTGMEPMLQPDEADRPNPRSAMLGGDRRIIVPKEESDG